jgi:hypothetical protein
MADVKTISSCIFPMVDDLDKEYATIQKVLRVTLAKYRNEHNVNVIDQANDQLDEEFVYVPVQYTLWEGRYVRYLDLSSPLEMRFKSGGFVVNDNSYTVTIKNDQGVFRVGKRGRLFFMKLSEKDLKYMQFRNMF